MAISSIYSKGILPAWQAATKTTPRKVMTGIGLGIPTGLGLYSGVRTYRKARQAERIMDAFQNPKNWMMAGGVTLGGLLLYTMLSRMMGR